MKTFSIILFTLFTIFSVAYTLNSKKQDDDGDMKSLMKELMRGVVAQVQEEEDQKSSAELESALSDLLSQVQDDEDEGGRIQDDEDEGGRTQDEDDEGGRKQDEDDEGGRKQDEDDEGGKQDDGDDLLALLQEDDDDDGARRQDEDGDDLLAFLQEDDNDDDGAVMQEGDDEGGDAIEQGWFGRIFRGIRRFGGRVRNVCNRVSRYSRALNCLPRMQAEVQKAQEGDDELARDLLRRIANLQQEGGDGDAEAQFFKRIFKGVRKFFKRGRGIFRGIRRRVGGLVRGYRGIRRCMRRYGRRG